MMIQKKNILHFNWRRKFKDIRSSNSCELQEYFPLKNKDRRDNIRCGKIIEARYMISLDLAVATRESSRLKIKVTCARTKSGRVSKNAKKRQQVGA